MVEQSNRRAIFTPVQLRQLRAGGGADHSLGQPCKKGLRFALNLSTEVQGLHVDSGEGSRVLRENWHRFVEEPAKKVGLSPPELIVLESPYRFVINPILTYVRDLERKNPAREVAVLVPELVVQRWYHDFLHNRRAARLKTLLLLKGNQRIIVIDDLWYLR